MKWHEYQQRKAQANFSSQQDFSLSSNLTAIKNKVVPVYQAVQRGARFVSAIAKWITIGATILGGVGSLAVFKREWDLLIRNFKVDPNRFYILEHDSIRKERMRLLGDPRGYERDVDAYKVLTELSGRGYELFLESGEKLATNYNKRFTQINDPDVGKLTVLEFTPS